ncbi:hypothetical protein WG66_014210 [Moniliophthora roreri]|nr:hypothetical protein WG66_014210 [Moniliophthora roreri]
MNQQSSTMTGLTSPCLSVEVESNFLKDTFEASVADSIGDLLMRKIGVGIIRQGYRSKIVQEAVIFFQFNLRAPPCRHQLGIAGLLYRLISIGSAPAVARPTGAF